MASNSLRLIGWDMIFIMMFFRFEEQKYNFSSIVPEKRINMFIPQLHLQNHCHDSAGLGGEDWGGETITLSRLQKLTNLKNGFVYDEIRTLVDGYCQ